VSHQEPSPEARRGCLITLEGIDNCGKSTQVALLCAALVQHGIAVGPEEMPGVALREPGATPVGERIRDVLLHSTGAIDPRTEALLYAAARAELAAVLIRPALAQGRVIVLDRYIDSAFAYQGWGRGIGIDTVLEMNRSVADDLMPDVTFLLALTAAEAAGRTAGPPDRIEREGMAFQARVADGYAELAGRYAERYVVVDATLSPEAIAEQILARVLAVLEAVCV